MAKYAILLLASIVASANADTCNIGYKFDCGDIGTTEVVIKI